MAIVDKELFSIAYRNLAIHKLRSLLTLLGIIIGIAAIVALVSIGEGLTQSVTQQFEKLGLDTLFVEPGSGTGISTAVSRALREEDIGIIEGVPGVERAIGFYETAAIAEFKRQQTGAFIIGYDPADTDYLERIGYIDMVEGRPLEKNDRFAIVIPENMVEQGFVDETLRVRDQLEINGQNFKIVGITKNVSASFGGFAPSINMIFVNKDTVQDFFGAKDPVEIAVIATDRTLVNDVSDKITERLKRSHGEEDFYVMSTENILESAGLVIGMVQMVLVFLAGISLVVGGIGIMNTMLMAIMERTAEIGVMKAIGATNTKIRALFLAEAALVGGIGGIIGTIFGLLIATGVSAAANIYGFSLGIGINPFAIIGAIGFAMLVGMLSGYLPARRAAMLEPVEALRYGK